MTDRDPFSLVDRRILVTGASSGIGREIALQCAQAGAQLVMTGRDSDRLNATLNMLPPTGHLAIAADLTQAQDIERLASECGTLNGVVHAAGISRLVPFHLINQSHLNSMFASNTYGPMLLTRQLLAKKRIANSGSLLFVSALASHTGAKATATYSASKSALLGMMRSLALDVGKQGIRVNCLAPGYVRTPMLDSLAQGGSNMDALYDLSPLGMGEPEDIAHAAVYYLSDASRWVTRNYFIIDGGLSAGMSIHA